MWFWESWESWERLVKGSVSGTLVLSASCAKEPTSASCPQTSPELLGLHEGAELWDDRASEENTEEVADSGEDSEEVTEVASREGGVFADELCACVTTSRYESIDY